LPGTEIPRNRPGIDDPVLLQEIESALLAQAYRVFIDELSPDTRFDEACFKSLHARAFSTLYGWAGQYRTVDMVKGGSLFCRAEYLPKESTRLFARLESEGFLKDAKGWPRERFAERLADYQSELIALHPFLELNGRITRLFFDLIAIGNGYAPIDYQGALTVDESGQNAYIRASIACVQQADHRTLQRIILDGLQRVEETA
jgi:cell filamentation protein